MDTKSFYSDLPVLNNFIDVTDSRNFKSVPGDWYIIITDIVASTQAIEDGRYKDVNLLGACCIAVVLNIAGRIEIPFVFGGDGAALLIPPSLYSEAIRALLATRQRAKVEFGMDLRIGVVPVSDISRTNYDVKIAKIRVSENYYQAAFTGNGLSYATELIKNPVTAEIYNHKNTVTNSEADFSGLECRWQDIFSKHGEMVSLLVKATSRSDEIDFQIYQEVIDKIQAIYGNEDCLNPIAKEHLNLAFRYKNLKSETRLRAKSQGFWHKSLYLSKILGEILLGWLLITFKIKLSDLDWGNFKETIIAATDYRKFDDMLRMVIAGNEAQRQELTSYLEEKYRKGELVYGLHVSDRALMTCLIFERNGRQVHFIDGADGGYAVAAKAMKQRIERLLHYLISGIK
jgi:hypothetical protein